MTIEDGLEELEDKGKKKADEKPEESITVNTSHDIIKRGHGILGEYLRNTFFGDAQLSDPARHFISTFGPYLLTIKPGRINNSSSPHHEVQFVDSIEKEYWLACLESTGKGYLLQTDLGNVKNPVELYAAGETCIPGFSSVTRSIPSMMPANPNPYVLVMGMKTELRPVMAITIDTGIKNKKIQIKKSQNTPTREMLFNSIPTIDIIADAAEELKITSLQSIIHEFNRVLDEYKKEWG